MHRQGGTKLATATLQREGVRKRRREAGRRVDQGGDRTLKCSGQARSKGRAPLFLVSKQNLNPSSWHI
jgi:hypothetical protein